MQAYISMFNWTEQGVRNAKDTVNRARAAAQVWQAAGGRLVGIWWTQGQYDGFFITEAPDDATQTRLLIEMGRAGNIRTTTLRAFSEEEMGHIVQGLS